MHVTLSNNWHALQPYLIDDAMLSISPAGRGQLVKLLITLEPHGIFAYLYILDTGMQNGDEASSSISPADRGQLVKMLRHNY